MIQINLIPDVKRDLLKAQRVRNLVIFGSIVTMAAGIGVLVLTVGALFAQNLIISNNNTSIDKKFNKLSSIDGVNVNITLKNQLNEINNIRNSAPVMSRLESVIFGVIPDYALSDDKSLTISSVDFSPVSGLLSIEGEAKTTDAVESFKKNIEQAEMIYRVDSDLSKPVDGAACDFNKKGSDGCIIEPLVEGGMSIPEPEASISKDESGAKKTRFKISFNLSKNALKFQNKHFALRSPDKKDATDSTVFIPNNLFKASPDKQEEKKDE